MSYPFEVGDIVEVSYPKNHEFAAWNGCTFEVVDIETSGIICIVGKVIKIAPDPSVKSSSNQIGAKIRWSKPRDLKIVSSRQKYLSPFTGKWS